VPKRDHIGPECRARAIETFIARPASRVLDGPPLVPRSRRDVAAFDHDAQAERFRESDRKLLVTAGRGAKLMIEMHEPGRFELARGSEIAHDVRKGDRVGAPRQRDHHAGAAPGEVVLRDETTNAGD
jgi:hypothetical protein